MFPRSGPLLINRIHLSSVGSTNSYARAHASSFDLRSLTVVTADEQTAGRGRGDRAWSSGGADDVKLTFAFGVPQARVASAYLLSPLLSVAAVRALRGAGVAGDVGIKWPNDVVMGGARKVGGVLCEMEGASGGDFVAALGIGLNVNSLPEALAVARAAWPLTTLRAERPDRARLCVHALTEALVAEFAAALRVFAASGWAPFAAEYAAASVLLGRRVRFCADAPGAVVEGVAAAFSDDGALLLRQDDGALRAFLAGEVTGVVLADALVEGFREPGGGGGGGES
jgi:BirA family biotin operon repressor/biotin-[acetyl-CoA-carboxylase] ligase